MARRTARGDLTRLRTLGALRTYIRGHHRPPTYTELAAEAGLSKARLSGVIDDLVADGLVRREPGSRGLFPVDPPGGAALCR